jgi:hypothetical protein
MEDYELMLNAYKTAGGTPSIFKDSGIANLMVHKNRVLGSNLVPGLILIPKETSDGVDIDLTIKKGYKIVNPVHLCFGILPQQGRQVINIREKSEPNSSVKVLAHCVFPNAVKVEHIMEANFEIEENASFEYTEVHYHGLSGGARVVPHAKVKVGDNGRFLATFSLLHGRVGELDIDYEVLVLQDGLTELLAKVYGYGEDNIKIRESGMLQGPGSRGLVKSRIAVKDKAQSEVLSELTAHAQGARGHVDCIEVVQGKAKAKAIPVIYVTNSLAKVTHEAAIGRVDQKQVETLMARGLKEEEAVDVVIGGMLR